MTNSCTIQFLDAPGFAGEAAHKIAYHKLEGKQPGIVFCGGLKSDMEGSKATLLQDWAAQQRRGFVRFDYFGHGLSSGRFRDGTISRWARDSVQVIDTLTKGPQIIIGSSMGGWTALLAALARPERIKALILLAPAPDFTEKLMWAGFDEKIRKTIMEAGLYLQPSDYDEPYEISRDLIVDGRKNLLLDAPINLNIPVRILQGQKDTSVPWQYALKLTQALSGNDVVLSLIKDGDHSLSRPQDMDRLFGFITEMP